MRIAIDARELCGRPTGVGRYLDRILRGWANLPAAALHEYVLCAPETPSLEPLSFHVTITTRSGSGTRWEQFTLPSLLRHVKADVLFAPGYSGPILSHVPMVLTIHDVSFAAHPGWFGWREGLRRRALTRWAARRASRVLTISEFSRNEIVRHLGISSAKVEVIYPGATAYPSPGRTADEPIVLFVGSLFNRRNIPELIAGFARVAGRHPHVRLEIVGENRTIPHVDADALARGSGAGDRIAVRSYVAADTLASLYGSAHLFVFLSDYEGFALTPLDALASGIPVILLDTPVAREIYGDAALYVPRADPLSVADAIERLLFDDNERARLLCVAPSVVARYSWQECAQRVLDELLVHGER